MRRLPPRSTLTDTLFPDTTLCRSLAADEGDRYARFDVSTYTRSLFNHCDRALSHAYRLGPHGLPLIGADDWNDGMDRVGRSEEHTSELQSLMRISYAVFCLKKKKNKQKT